MPLENVLHFFLSQKLLFKKKKRKKGLNKFSISLDNKMKLSILCLCFLKIDLYIENNFAFVHCKELPHNYFGISRDVWDQVYQIGRVQWWL